MRLTLLQIAWNALLFKMNKRSIAIIVSKNSLQVLLSIFDRAITVCTPHGPPCRGHRKSFIEVHDLEKKTGSAVSAKGYPARHFELRSSLCCRRSACRWPGLCTGCIRCAVARRGLWGRRRTRQYPPCETKRRRRVIFVSSRWRKETLQKWLVHMVRCAFLAILVTN